MFSIQSLKCISIYASQIHFYANDTFFISEGYLKWHSPLYNAPLYWRLKAIENEEGVHVFELFEESIPLLLPFSMDSEIAPNQHLIIGSSFSFQDQHIMKVQFFGYSEYDQSYCTDIVLYFPNSTISLKAGAVIEINYGQHEQYEPEQLLETLYA